MKNILILGAIIIVVLTLILILGKSKETNVPATQNEPVVDTTAEPTNDAEADMSVTSDSATTITTTPE